MFVVTGMRLIGKVSVQLWLRRTKWLLGMVPPEQWIAIVSVKLRFQKKPWMRSFQILS